MGGQPPSIISTVPTSIPIGGCIWGDLGLTRGANLGLGLGIVLTFFAVVFWWLRPRTGRELAWYLGVVARPRCCSP